MSPLRETILKHSLPLIPTHSFTRQTLLSSLPSLPPSHKNYQPDINPSIIDTIFGQGSAGPKSLLEAWEVEGLRHVQGGEGGAGAGKDIKERLRRRLRYSSEAGEHLVEAYALMSSPGNTPSVPIPKIPLSVLKTMKLPQLYSPSSSSPSSPLSTSTPSPSSSPLDLNQSAQSVESGISRLIEQSAGRIPFISINPLGSLSYAWRIVDAALKVDEKAQGVQTGLMSEPTGSGPEWYSSRISLLLAYLSAESHLLQPYPQDLPSSSPNPYLINAEKSLEDHLSRYNIVAESFGSGVKSTGHFMDYLGHIGRSAIGVIRSRGL